MSEEQIETKTAGDLRIRREGTASEVVIPFQQYLRLVFAASIEFAAISAIAWLLGPWSLWLPGLALAALLIRAAAATGNGLEPGRVAALLATTTLGAAWALFGLDVCRATWIVPVPDWPWQFRAYAIAAILVIIGATTIWLIYRYAGEIVDPSGPTAPRAPIVRGGTHWPWTPEPESPANGNSPDMNEIRGMIEDTLNLQRDSVQIEVTHGHNGSGRIRAGGGLKYDQLPFDHETLQKLRRLNRAGRVRFSRRYLSSHLRDVGDDRARTILDELEQKGYIHYPDGLNHPDGAQLTAKGRALFG